MGGIRTKGNLTILKNEIKIGLKKPISFLHITDSHLTRGDTTGWNREAHFDVDYKGCKEDYFFEALNYARKKNLLVVHTGDIIDFFSCENFQVIGEQLKEIDYIYAAGNHDFCHDLAAPKDENYEYKHKHIKEIAPLINSNLLFDSRIVGEVNIITLDDSYYLISDGQLDMLKAEVAKGYPIILAMHVPFYTEEHAKKVFSDGHKCAWLVGAPQGRA